MENNCCRVLMSTRGFSLVVAKSFMRNLTNDEVAALEACVDAKGNVTKQALVVNAAINERLAATQKAVVDDAAAAVESSDDDTAEFDDAS